MRSISGTSTASGNMTDVYYDNCSYEGTAAPFKLSSTHNKFNSLNSNFTSFKGSKIEMKGTTAMFATQGTNFTDTENVVQIDSIGDVMVFLEKDNIKSSVSNAIEILNSATTKLSVDTVNMHGANSVIKVKGSIKLQAQIKKFVVDTANTEPLQIASNFSQASSVELQECQLPMANVKLIFEGTV